MGLEKKKLTLFFSCGISLGTWENTGNLTREIKLYNGLAQHFEKIWLVTYGSKEELRYKERLPKNIEVLPKKIALPSRIYQFLIPFIYRKELRETDIYKTNQITASIPAVLSKWLYKKILIVRSGYEWLRFMENGKKPTWKLWVGFLLEKLAYKSADLILVTSFEDKKFVEKRFKIPFAQIEIIPNYVDTNLFRPIKLPKEKNRICFVGRLSPQKNLFNLLRAISGLEVKLVIFGNGLLRERLEILDKELDSQVEFRGNIPNTALPEELNKSEVFILPSFYEGNPKVLLEAMACGLPCIGTNYAGIREIISNRENGYLCETSVGSIRKAIVQVLQHEALRKKIGENARRTISEKFSLNDLLATEVKIYESI